MKTSSLCLWLKLERLDTEEGGGMEMAGFSRDQQVLLVRRGD
jgi:hypothetical protein